MIRGFYTILAAQFFSALADNALLFAAIALLKDVHAPSWQTPVLQVFFVFSYIVLAPFVGPLADAIPKGRVMFISNAVKIVGCIAMLSGLHPLLAYGVVGVGAAMYSPAKYGILTEYLPHQKLVWANGWMEGLTVAAIILGAILGGYLVGGKFLDFAAGHFAHLRHHSWVTSGPGYAILAVLGIYVVASIINLYIPRVALDHKLPKKTPLYILQDFWHCLKLLWRDPLGQVSLAVTTLFWGAGATLRLLVLEWAGPALGFSLSKATQLSAVTAVGIAVGSVLAAKFVSLNHSVRVLPMGIFMGLGVMAIAAVTNWHLAMVLLILVGAMGGFFVVPMNALLQHRGHLLMGAGHSIAVQNFNENISILVMNGLYAALDRGGVQVNYIIIVFGLMVTASMFWLWRKHGHDQD
ncbi:MAG TPA: lysophospholipid transporter LplT [Burkholderiales bacterium]|nr:lysophospholipid transporter LplT [Burkholderiales bacterium]